MPDNIEECEAVTSINPATPKPYLPWSVWPAQLRHTVLALWGVFWLLMIFISVQDNWNDATILWRQPLVWPVTAQLRNIQEYQTHPQ